jgi:hypothetical protein
MKLLAAICVVMVPALVSAQHRGADTGTGGAAVPTGSFSSSSGSSSSSSGDSSSSSNSGSIFQSSSNTGGSSVGHRTGSISVPPPNPGAANTNSGAFTNYSNLTFPAPEFARPRSSLPLNTAFTKGSVPTLSLTNNSNNNVTFLPGYNPWLYAYGGLYGIPFYGAFDPFAVDFGYVGPTVWTTTTPSSSAKPDKGILRLNVKPYDAEVHVDGVLVGKANHFEGVFHKLRLDAGVHHLELRASGYEPLTVNVRIEAGESMTYRGSLEKTAP